ncbi:hypothetical protein T265_07780 [Opisthorchis viverrini]|uniref:Uncharacterized protein n=1 Tax=Opisthorchis viverrini TaxID=6198 RepID=A0A074ZG00_OPIVI|nr:hypothetical protein T265_07780 [Opisthorchis viverrini]KER24582.1 hypothetical protein T265_07780 [Opisthorchis viverrini]
MEPPPVSEVSECTSLLKRHRAAGPDDLPPALFKDGGGFPSQCPSSLFGSTWEKEAVPDNWGESIVVPIPKQGTRNECDNHRGDQMTIEYHPDRQSSYLLSNILQFFRFHQTNHTEATVNGYQIKYRRLRSFAHYNAHAGTSNCSALCITRGGQPEPGKE